MRVILFSRADGGVTFRHPAANARLMAGYEDEMFEEPIPAFNVWVQGPQPNGIIWAETEDEFLQRLVMDAKMPRFAGYDGAGMPIILPPKAVDEPAIVDPSIKPVDRSLRNAWKRSGNAVVEDLARARDLAAKTGMSNPNSASIEEIRVHMKEWVHGRHPD